MRYPSKDRSTSTGLIRKIQPVRQTHKDHQPTKNTEKFLENGYITKIRNYQKKKKKYLFILNTLIHRCGEMKKKKEKCVTGTSLD